MAAIPISITIRPCRAEDLPSVLALLDQLDEFSHIEHQLDLERLQDLFAEMQAAPEIYHNLVCTIDEIIAGFLAMIFYRTLFHTGGTALINELVIDQAQRGRGLGQALVAAAIKAAKERGMDEIEVGTEYSNRAAQKFYHKAGFDEEFVLLGMEFEEE